ncbi:hypothetical protein Ddc_24809 [Ditylenchus destructor]|nr:hypothetical protein Ddc_24809 [Ditylenchus destructor]
MFWNNRKQNAFKLHCIDSYLCDEAAMQPQKIERSFAEIKRGCVLADTNYRNLKTKENINRLQTKPLYRLPNNGAEGTIYS